MTNSRAQDTAATIVAAQKEVEAATRAYNKGGGVDRVNAANKRLADCHNELYRVNAGLARDDR